MLSDPSHLSAGFSIEGPSQAKIECDDKGDGSCDVRYWPTEPGEYAVHVICDDEDIRDSPFIAHIQPAPPDCFPDKVGSRLPHSAWTGLRCTGPPPVPSPTLHSCPTQVKAFGPGLEPTGCIVDKPAEFTIDARAAGKGDLKLYAQVGHSLSPQCPTAPYRGLQKGGCNITERRD